MILIPAVFIIIIFVVLMTVISEFFLTVIPVVGMKVDMSVLLP